MGMIRGLFTTTSEMEAYAHFRALTQEDGLLARYLFPRDPVRRPQLKKGLEYLRSPGKGA